MTQMQDDSWIQTLLLSLKSEQYSPCGDRIPEYPPEELQRNTTGLASEAALRQAFAFYQDVRDSLTRAGVRLATDSQLLDFGFGWGRISRVFMKDVPVSGIHGIDVDPDFVELTRRHFRSDRFKLCPAFPPTSYPNGKFDVIYAYSVFSHLSPKAATEWMAEFHRILKPGGVVAFTTRHESFFDYCQWAATQEAGDDYLRALGKLFPDLDAARASYRAGEVVHGSSTGVGGGGPRDSSFYGETWIPEKFVRNGFGPGFEFVAGYFDGTRYDQACFALRRTG